MSLAVKAPNHALPTRITLAEFLAWPGDGTDTRYELVNGVLRAQDAASDAHGTIQSRLNTLLTNHLDRMRPGCRVVANPGIQPRLRADWNHRISELGVTCTGNRPDVHAMPDPLLLIEILSPTNVDDTWSNIALYATLPTVNEILIVDSTKIAVDLLRRGANGSWPQSPEVIAAGGVVHLASIDLQLPVVEIYRGTHLADAAPSAGEPQAQP